MKKIIPTVFKIDGLFGEYNVVLPLNDPVNVFLGENGMGKTTILSCLYYSLSGKIEQLSNLSFKKILITFSNKKELVLNKEDLTAYIEQYMDNRRMRVNITRIFSEDDLRHLRNEFAHSGSFKSDIAQKYIFRISEMLDVPNRYAERELMRYLELYGGIESVGKYENAAKFKKDITQLVNSDILYFPTYRRIEEDISKLGLDLDKDRNNVKDKLIQFGMADVDAAIKNILESIRTLAINGFTQMTGLLLKQYLDEEDTIITSKRKINIEKLIIALDRIGNEIADQDKKRIINSVQSKEIYSSEKSYLRNLINQLIDSYEQQNYYDERVKKFVSVCNGYLTTKKYYYNESKVELDIYRTDKNGEIIFDSKLSTQNLSSGEKQIISIFAKLYLEKAEPCIILFDEPELSLSIQWQEKFLPDIMDAKTCSQLIAVTHSPFIFDNQFDKYAKDMSDCLALIER